MAGEGPPSMPLLARVATEGVDGDPTVPAMDMLHLEGRGKTVAALVLTELLPDCFASSIL
jgi:hypothetical protein